MVSKQNWKETSFILNLWKEKESTVKYLFKGSKKLSRFKFKFKVKSRKRTKVLSLLMILRN